MKYFLNTFLPLVGIFLMAFGVNFLFNIDWKWVIVVLYAIDQLIPESDDIQSKDS